LQAAREADPEGSALLRRGRKLVVREQAIRGVAGYTEVGRERDAKMVEHLRARGVIRQPQDLGIDPFDADRRLLAARSIKDLVRWSGGLYSPPTRCTVPWEAPNASVTTACICTSVRGPTPPDCL